VLYTPHGVFGDFVSFNLVPQNQDKIRTGGAGPTAAKKNKSCAFSVFGLAAALLLDDDVVVPSTAESDVKKKFFLSFYFYFFNSVLISRSSCATLHVSKRRRRQIGAAG
jgi:hypothetical protein